MSKDSPKISVIMGIYNCSKTLSESIESIINQTYENWEFIICDDASGDDSYEVACHYASLYPEKIKVIKNEKNIKLAGSLNHCLTIASGEYIARQDGDDISIKDRFEKQVRFLNSHPDYMVVGTGMIPFDESGKKGIRLGKTEPQITDIPINNTFMHATIMMRKEGYDALNGYQVTTQTRRAEDYDLWIRFFAAGFKGYNLGEALYMVREDHQAFARREVKHFFDLAFLVYRACRLLRLPLKYYLFILKPIIAGLTPNYLLKKYHKYRDVKQKETMQSDFKEVKGFDSKI